MIASDFIGPVIVAVALIVVAVVAYCEGRAEGKRRWKMDEIRAQIERDEQNHRDELIANFNTKKRSVGGIAMDGTPYRLYTIEELISP